MIKFIFKWVFRLVLGAMALLAILIIVLLLSYNSILRTIMERNIREQTGMDAEIGRLHVSLTEPTIEIQDFQIYNPANFGGTPFVNFQEIHMEYDLAALMKGQLHFPLVRVKLAELDIVKNQDGQLNILAMNPQPATPPPAMSSSVRQPGATTPPGQLGITAPIVAPKISPGSTSTAPRPSPANPPIFNFQGQTGYEFTGIDKLNLSYEKEKYIDLQNHANDCEQVVGLDNWVIPHVRTMNDLAGTMVIIDLKSGQFFQNIAAKNIQGGNANVLRSALQSIGL